MTESALTDLKDKIKNVFNNEKGIEQPDKIIHVVEKIVDFNERYQEGQGLKILTLNQMLSRLPVSLAQLKSRNSSKKKKTNKLINEMRQLLYTLHRSKKLTETIYNSLINTI